MQVFLRSWFRRSQLAWTVPIVACMTIGVGLNSAAFQVFVQAIVTPLAGYRSPDRLVLVWATKEGARTPLSLPEFRDLQANVSAFESSAGAESIRVDLSDGTRPRALSVTAGYFDVAGLNPDLGRTFRPDDRQVTVLSRNFWENRFQADNSVIGQQLATASGARLEIVGVLPPHLEPSGIRPDLWLLRATEADPPGARLDRNLVVVARLKKGVAIQDARRQADRWAARLGSIHPQASSGFSYEIISLYESVVGERSKTVLILCSMTFLILLLAAATLARAVLARGRRRCSEIAVRMALGADRKQLFRQFILESLPLGFLSILLALATAPLALQLLAHRLSAGLPAGLVIQTDWRIIGFALGCTLVLVLSTSLAPLQASFDARLIAQLRREGEVGQRRGWSGQLLVVVQVAAAMIFLFGAGLLLNAYARIKAVDLGFQTRDVASYTILLGHPSDGNLSHNRLFWREILRRMSELPAQIDSVAATTDLPMWTSGFRQPVGLGDGFTANSPIERVVTITPGYLQTLGIPLLEGRDFSDRDDETAPGVAMVNESFAALHYGGGSPLGRRMETLSGPVAIIGLVSDTHMESLFDQPQPVFYVSSLQAQFGSANFLLVKGPRSIELYPQVKAIVEDLRPGQTVDRPLDLEKWVYRRLDTHETIMLLLLVLASAGTILAVFSVSSVAAERISQKRRELAIRLALGAPSQSVVLLVVLPILALTGLGIILGAALALLFSQALSQFLYQLDPRDLETVGASLLLLFFLVFVATILSTRRITNTNLADLLRAE